MDNSYFQFPFLVPFLPTASKPTDPKAFTSPATSLNSGNGNDEALGSRNLLLPALCAADTLRVRASFGREAADQHWWFTSDRMEAQEGIISLHNATAYPQHSKSLSPPKSLSKVLKSRNNVFRELTYMTKMNVLEPPSPFTFSGPLLTHQPQPRLNSLLGLKQNRYTKHCLPRATGSWIAYGSKSTTWKSQVFSSVKHNT